MFLVPKADLSSNLGTSLNLTKFIPFPINFLNVKPSATNLPEKFYTNNPLSDLLILPILP